MSLKISRTLIQTLAITILLAGLVHFTKIRGVSANGVQSEIISTVTNALAAQNRITFSIAEGEDADVGDSAIVAGDFNRDGQVDLAIANDNFQGVNVRLGLPDFQNDATYPTGPGANEVLTTDFNHDGNLDLAVANSGTKTVSILLGNGDGTFHKINDVLLAGSPNGRPDIALISGNTEAMVFVDNPSGQLQLHSSFKLPNASIASSMAWGSFNHDALPDLAFRVFDICGRSCSFANSVYVFLNTGTGSFVSRRRKRKFGRRFDCRHGCKWR